MGYELVRKLDRKISQIINYNTGVSWIVLFVHIMIIFMVIVDIHTTPVAYALCLIQHWQLALPSTNPIAPYRPLTGI